MDLTNRRVVELDVLSAKHSQRLTVALIPGMGPSVAELVEKARIQLGGSFVDVGQVSLQPYVPRNPALGGPEPSSLPLRADSTNGALLLLTESTSPLTGCGVRRRGSARVD